MFWISILVGIASAIFFGALFSYLFKNKTVSATLTALMIMLFVFIAHDIIGPYYYTWGLERALRNSSPLFQLIAQDSPREFDEYVDNVKRNIIKRGDPKNKILYAAELTQTVFVKHIPTASNISVYNYIKNRLDIYNKLLDVNPSYILAMEFQNKDFDELGMLLAKNKDYQRYLVNNNAAIEQIIMSSIKNPHTELTDEDKKEAAIILRDIFLTLYKEFGEDVANDVFSQIPRGDISDEKAARVIIRLYDLMTQRGERDTGIATKYLYYLQRMRSQQ